MTLRAQPPTGGDTHVEAFRCTGTSPGRDAAAPLGPGGTPVSWEVHGPEEAPPVVVLGGISATRHLAPTLADPTSGWWPGVVGAGLGLDPARQRLIGVQWLTGSSGIPTTADQARAVLAVLDAEGIGRATLVGASYGGMVALAFAEAYPERVDRLVVLCAAHRPHPMATALRSVQRAIVHLGSGSGDGGAGLALARQLAMTTYRSAEEFEDRFGSAPDDASSPRPRFPVEAYLEARGRDFAGRVGPADFLALSTSIDCHRVDPASIRAPVSLVSFDTDALVPPWLVEELARGLGGAATHRRLRSRYGHDAFLKETRAVSALLATELKCGQPDGTKPDRAEPNRAAPERAGPEPSRPGRAQTERAAPERAGLEREGGVR